MSRWGNLRDLPHLPWMDVFLTLPQIDNTMWGVAKREEKIPSSWKRITNENSTAEIIERSKDHPIAIFMHSTHCSRSAYAKERLENEHALSSNKLTVLYLDLLEHRSLSDRIASDLKIIHQSPQFIVVKNGRVVYAASHESISYAKALSSL